EKELVLRQHMLLDLGAEREFIEGLKGEIEPFRACASYNGKAFDLPIIRTRFVMAIRSEVTVDDSHLDLLHPARRLWRDRFGSTTLKQLEESVLDDGRTADIPGWLIPDAYFHYLRKRDPAIIAPVLEHNARDVISLVRITDRVARAVAAARAGRAPDHAPAALALARGFERTGEIDAVFADIPGWLIPDAYFHYLRKRDPAIIAPVLEHNARDVISLVRITDRVARAVAAARAGRAPDHAPAALALARGFERTGEIDAAFACYESAYYDGDNALRTKLALSYARHLERRGDLERALQMIETLVELGLGSERWREQAESRIRRLSKKKWRKALPTASCRSGR